MRRNALCTLSFVDILDKDRSFFAVRLDLRRDDGRRFTFYQRDGSGQAFPFLFGDKCQVVEDIDQVNSPKCILGRFAGDYKVLLTERKRFHELRPDAFHQFVFDDRDDRPVFER